jgi:hypothetical protein
MDTISGFSGKSYKEIVQKKDPGNHEMMSMVPGSRPKFYSKTQSLQNFISMRLSNTGVHISESYGRVTF